METLDIKWLNATSRDVIDVTDYEDQFFEIWQQLAAMVLYDL